VRLEALRHERRAQLLGAAKHQQPDGFRAVARDDVISFAALAGLSTLAAAGAAEANPGDSQHHLDFQPALAPQRLLSHNALDLLLGGHTYLLEKLAQ
jgi:hypothetical protein